jgi:hypothetical protein
MWPQSLIMKMGSIGIKLDMKHRSPRVEIPEHRIGSLCLTIAPAPAFSSSEREQNILEQFPKPHLSNLSPGIFTIPDIDFSQTEPPESSTTTDLSPIKKKPGLHPYQATNSPKRNGGIGLQAPKSQPNLFSVLDLNLTFKEPDEFEKPELGPIRRAFGDLMRELRLVVPMGVRHPVRYIRDRRQIP